MRALGVVLLLCACGGVRYAPSTTRGVGCSDLTEAWCDRLIQCGTAPSGNRAICIQGGQSGCCGSTHTCGDPISNPDGAANCVNQLPGADCASLGTPGAPMLPAFCKQMF